MKLNVIEEIMRDFDPGKSGEDSDRTKGQMVGVWLPNDYKNRYDRLQQTSRREFGKKVRDVIKAVIDHVDKSA